MDERYKTIWNLQRKYFCEICMSYFALNKVIEDNQMEIERIMEEEVKNGNEGFPIHTYSIAVRYFENDLNNVHGEQSLQLLNEAKTFKNDQPTSMNLQSIYARQYDNK